MVQDPLKFKSETSLKEKSSMSSSTTNTKARTTRSEKTGDRSSSKTSTKVVTNMSAGPKTNKTTIAQQTSNVSSIGNSTQTADSTNATITAAHSKTSPSNDHDSSHAGLAIAVVITLGCIIALAVVAYVYLKKKGKLKHFKLRKRRSSTSNSRQALDADYPDREVDEVHIQRNQKTEPNQPFTIEDVEDEDYYYDEAYGRSEFSDKNTQIAVRELRSVSEEDANDTYYDDDEILDLDFETLGIKIGDTKIETGRKFTV